MCDFTSKEWFKSDLKENTKYMFASERRKTFKKWPFEADSNCSIERMVEAGFYCPAKSASSEPDLVCCFFCYKELDCWDSTDNPWEEHLRHSPECEFASIAKRQSEYKPQEMIKLIMNLQKNTLRKLKSVQQDIKLKMYEEKTSKLSKKKT